MRATLFFRNLILVFGFFLLTFSGRAVHAQNPVYGNEWINYGQTYYKIKVLNSGMHRLTYNDLAAAGISNVNPQKFQLFRRGRELAVYVNGQSDGILNAGDYIDFYGQRNDGQTDTELYASPANQVHKHYNLFQDTAAYFLTWGTANGKRMVEKTSQNAGLTPEPRHYAERLKLITTNYFPGYQTTSTIGPLGDMSEGFMSNFFRQSRRDTISTLTNASSGGRNPVVEVGVVGAFYYQHSVKVLVIPPGGPARVLTNATTGSSGLIQMPSFHFRVPKFEILPSDIHPNGTLALRVAVADSVTAPPPNIDIIRVSHYKITYPRDNNLNNSDREIFTDSLRANPSYYLFDNPPVNAVAFDITDPYNVVRTQGITVGSQRGFVFDPSTNRRKILIAKSETSRSPIAIKSVTFQAINPANFNYIILTHKSLRVPVAGTSSQDPATDYAAYRASVPGGAYQPLIAEIDDIYNQFHYGEKSSLAITNFSNWMLANGQPKFLLLMGKGLDRINPENLTGSPKGDIRTRPEYYKNLGYGEDLIPTFGFPASDVLLTADWKNGSFVPKIPTGRIPANSAQQVLNYLDKIMLHESLGNEEWRKNVLHLGGGNDNGEARVFENYLNNYKNKIEAPLLGARVKSIFRQNVGGGGTTPININKELNAGLSLITFFGHSSTTVSDLDVGYVSDPIFGYNNQGKYPMVLMNGCSSGNSFLFKDLVSNRYSFGEDWLLTANKGSLLLIADVNMALPFALNNYSSNFYSIAFSDPAFYGKPIGEIQKETILRSLSGSPNNWEYRGVAAEMLLQGDPAVRLFSPEKPDYAFKANGVKLQSNPKGETVTANSAKFDLVLDLRNHGKAIEDSLVISVKRTLPNGSVIQYPARKFKPLFNDDTYFFTIDNKNINGFGDNKFEVFLDFGNLIPELDENNNTAVLNQYLSVNGVIALLPKEFDIVSTPTVKLIGQPANLLSPDRDYWFELDTIPTFTSSVRQTALVRNGGNAPSWITTLLPNSSPDDSIVYYWRFRFNTFGPKEDTIWAQSSFRFIPGSPDGWSQSHYGQYARNELNQVVIDPVTHKLEFAPIAKELLLKTAGGAKLFVPNSMGIYQDNVSLTTFFCNNNNTPVFALTVFDENTLVPVKNLSTGGISSGPCGPNFNNYFFHIDGVNAQAQLDSMANFIRRIPNGYYVALISQNNIPFSTFTQNQKNAFGLLGSQLINTLTTGDPFALVGRKGATSAQAVLLKEETALASNPTPANQQDITLTYTITGRGNQGTIISPRIGPAISWTTLHHTVKQSGRDKYTLDLYGFDKSGTRQLLVSDVTNQTYSLASVSAATYPYLQLQMAISDTAAVRTAPQLKQWMVTYQAVPEGMMRPDMVGIDKYKIDKQAASGKVNLRFAFMNISDIDFSDSLTVVRSVIGTSLMDTIKVKLLKANDSVFFDYSFSTGGMRGNNVARVEVNPQILPEQYYFNNFLEIPFNLPNADLHPVLEVAFDGVRIMDGDIVSPSPKISINLKDEDKYDFIKDPNNLEVFLKRPGAQQYERINLEDPTLVTLPDMSDANRDKREFNIIYHPKNLPDSPEGEDYQLRVQGKDNTENTAGFEPYTIRFKVINESAITHFYPYPNPFSSNTRFVFTLTGNPENMPQNVKIQIMTLTGKVVREIQKEELGIIRAGNNRSEPWDGTDEFGDKLANGVYLYRVVMDKSPLEEMKHRKTTADKAFKKEYGKLYILR